MSIERFDNLRAGDSAGVCRWRASEVAVANCGRRAFMIENATLDERRIGCVLVVTRLVAIGEGAVLIRVDIDRTMCRVARIRSGVVQIRANERIFDLTLADPHAYADRLDHTA
jgi:hypothetical protein